MLPFTQTRKDCIVTGNSKRSLLIENYFKGVIDILKILDNKNIVYVTTNKPYSNIVPGAKMQGLILIVFSSLTASQSSLE